MDDETIKKMFPQKESTPEPPKEKSVFTKTIDEKRAELELRKIEIEIEKLNAPNTSIDYFQKMLDLQQQHFNQLLNMQQQQSNLMLEIEKLKMGGESEDSMVYFLEMLKPILPSIMDKINNTKSVKSPEVLKTGTGDNTPPNISPTNEKGEKVNAEDYKQRIRDGKVSLEQAWIDFKKELPKYAEAMGFEQFKIEYEKIKKQK